jgi:hypothetical protein
MKQPDGGINGLDAGLNMPGAVAMKVTEPIGGPPPDMLVTVAVHTVWSIFPVPGPKTVGLQLTVVLDMGCA